jgi:hypothetical protein
MILCGVGVETMYRGGDKAGHIHQPYTGRLLAVQPPDHQICCQELDQLIVLGDLGSGC